MTGRVSYYAGLAAEDIAAKAYAAKGFQERERRWRGPEGEIDLILSLGDMTVFVEVKKSKDFETAASKLGARQLARIQGSALHYMAQLPWGQNSEVRVDAALVDEIGQVDILENVTMQ